MESAIKKYEAIIERVEEDIAQAEAFKADLMASYEQRNDLDDIIKVQSMVLKIADYISQKHMTKVELERQLNEYKEAYYAQIESE